MDPSKVAFSASGNIKEVGAIKNIQSSIFGFLHSHTPDIVWGNGHIKELLFVLLKSSRSKYVINFHTVLLRRSGPWGVRTPWFLRKFLFYRADIIICPSEFSADSVRMYFPYKKVISVLNGVELGLFDPSKENEAYLKEKYKLDLSLPVVAFVGALNARKRSDLFIALAKEMPEAQFIAVGRAVPEFDCLSAAHDLKNFQWVPSMPREDVAIFLASAAVFVFPSLNDASAAVILEAMASGAVPIVSKSGGSGEFFRDGESGFFIEESDAEEGAFLEKLHMLLANPSLRLKLSQAARKEAEQHSWSVAAKKYEEAILSL
jgi:glycosyltransferase involved in cell wall biosynthesis